jgi:hypothetical protein
MNRLRYPPARRRARQCRPAREVDQAKVGEQIEKASDDIQDAAKNDKE